MWSSAGFRSLNRGHYSSPVPGGLPLTFGSLPINSLRQAGLEDITPQINLNGLIKRKVISIKPLFS